MPYWGETMVNFGRKEPREWPCPVCETQNRRYMAQCTGCGERRPREYAGGRTIGIINIASHNEADGKI